MSLFLDTLVLSCGISFFVVFPLIFSRIRDYSKYLFLVGTGAMIGICFFDLIPDVFEMGGHSSLYIIGIVALLYSFIHLFYLREHEHNHNAQGLSHPLGSTQAITVFFCSMIAHSFASGILLAISHELSQKIASTVFMALVAHKGYEAMMLSSVLVEQRCNRAKKASLMMTYIISLPAGVILTFVFKESLDKAVAILMSSIAVGALMGCLVFDFLIPCLKQLRQKRLEVLWIVVGLVLTQIVMKGG